MKTADGSASEVLEVNLLRRHHLAAGDAGLVGRDALDVFDAPPFQPVGSFLPVPYATLGF
jgi:hypothetical protein